MHVQIIQKNLEQQQDYCGYSISKIRAFGHIENKYNYTIKQDCMKRFSEFPKKHVKNITDFEKKKMLPLTKEELKSHQDAKVCYISGKRILKNFYKT